MGATVIDAIAIPAILIAVLIGSDAMGITGNDSEPNRTVGLLILSSPLLYHWLFIGLLGQTLGKMALGIRVVNSEGRIPGLGWALVRESMGKFISLITLFLGFLSVAWDKEKRGWHDHLAGTYVIHYRTRR